MHVGALLALHPGAAVASAPRALAAIELAPVPAHVLNDSAAQGGGLDQPSALPESVPSPPSLARQPGGKAEIEIEAPAAGSEYVIGSQLSQRPVALGTIDVPYPDIGPEGSEVRVVLTLYINERGIVDRVQVEDSDVPAPLADAARRTFLLATFTPGRVHDQAVRSQVQVEVSFSAVPSGADAPGLR